MKCILDLYLYLHGLNFLDQNFNQQTGHIGWLQFKAAHSYLGHTCYSQGAGGAHSASGHY